jgi:glutaminase
VDIQALLHEIQQAVAPSVGQGAVADYIPGLAGVDPHQFGMAVVTTDGETYGVGDWDMPFSIQSISKVFTLALVLADDGDAIWQRVSREPSGTPFNSLVQLEYEQGRPRNPFINAGALVVTDRLLATTGDVRGRLLEFLRTESGNDRVDADQAIYASEAAHSHRNAALAHLLAGFGNLECSVSEVLDAYFWQCSLAMSCRDLAHAARFLATGGLRVGGERMLTRSQTKRVNAVMLTCGTYDAAGEFAYRVGLPGKSGVGGGILAVIPGRCTICVWSPALDHAGNSQAGVEALDEFTTRTGWSIF